MNFSIFKIASARAFPHAFMISLILLSSLAVLHDRAIADSGDEFRKATKAYEDGDYKTAIEEYSSYLKSTPSGEGYYNLANSYYRSKEIAPAILYYRKAFELLPRDADVKYNLKYAQKSVQDDSGILLGNERLLTFFPVSSSEAFLVLAFLTWGLVIAFSIPLWKNVKTYISLFKRGFLLVWLIWGGLCIARVSTQPKFGVINTEKAQVFSGFGTGNAVLFDLHQGTLMQVEDIVGEWSKIRLNDGKKGWVKLKDLII